MRMATITILSLFSGVGCMTVDDAVSSTSDEASAPTVEQTARHYTKLQSMTPKPVFVNPELAMLCRGASLADVEEGEKFRGLMPTPPSPFT